MEGGVSAGGEEVGEDGVGSLLMNKVLVVVHDFPPLGGSARNRWRSMGFDSLVHGFVPWLPLFLLPPLWQPVDSSGASAARGLDAIFANR